MNTEELRTRLTSLHQLLGESPALDPESRTLLRTVVQDIEKVLHQPAAAAAGQASTTDTYGYRLEALATRFEADHPAITGALRQLTDLLGKAGI